MAKQAVGIIERHVEKVVLGACVLLLLAVIVLYGAMSPNKAKLGMEEVPPDGVYSRIEAEADTLKKRLLNARPEVKPPGENPVVGIKESIESLLTKAQISPLLLPPVPFHPDPPFEPEGSSVNGKIALVEVPAPRDLNVYAGRTYGDVIPSVELANDRAGASSKSGTDFERMIEFNWVTISCLFNQLEVERLCRENGYQVGRLEHPILGLDIQRREVLPDGTFTEWEDTKLYYPAVLPDPPEITLDTSMGNPRVPAETMRDLGAYAELVRQEAVQVQIMRPLFPFPEAGDCWTIPEYQDLDPIELDAKYGVEDRYAELICPEESTREPTEREICQEAYRSATRELELKTSIEALQRARNNIAEGKLTGCDRATEAEMENLRLALDDAIARMEEEQEKGIPRTFADVPVQILWGHDGPTGILESDKTYQYRVRVKLYNRYSGLPLELETPSQATQIVLTGAWSEPSEEIYVEPKVAFFLSGYSSSRKTLKTDIFMWVQGYWKKQSFNAELGEYLGGRKRTRLPNGESLQVYYDTGNVVLDVIPEQAYRPVDIDKRSGEIAVEPSENTPSMIYIDASGHVMQKYLDQDKTDPARKEYQKKVSSARDRDQGRERDRNRDQDNPGNPGDSRDPGRA